MRQTIFIVFVLYLPLSESAMLHIENQSRYIAVFVDDSNNLPCASNAREVQPCLIMPLTTAAYALSRVEPLNATLYWVTIPVTQNLSANDLKQRASKNTANIAYQPVGSLKYEQVHCETPIAERISITIMLVGVIERTCEKGTDKYTSWIYKRNDVDLKVIIKDLPRANSPRRRIWVH